MEIIQFDRIADKIIELQNMHVILDSDVAELYGVETKRINEAVKNNPKRFPDGYIIETTKEDLEILRSKFSTAKLSKTRTLPKAFSELVSDESETTIELNLAVLKFKHTIKKKK